MTFNVSSLPPKLRAAAQRQHRWLSTLGIANRPWLIFGSAPNPTVPPELIASHARIDINNAGATAAALGLGGAAMTVRAKHKSWAEHPHISTDGLLWLHSYPSAILRLMLMYKPHDRVGSVRLLRRLHRDAIVGYVTGASILEIGELGKVTNGIAMACYGLMLGVPQIVLAGVSLSKTGHSYDDLGRHRRQVDEDAFVLSRLSHRPELLTTEPDLAADTGIRLWSYPASNGDR